MSAAALLFALTPAPARWPGIDESVVEKFAREAGRAPAPPFFGLEGDLLLFAFLCAGVVCGFLLGYFFRALLGKDGGSSAS